jgi:hypothetical protein
VPDPVVVLVVAVALLHGDWLLYARRRRRRRRIRRRLRPWPGLLQLLLLLLVLLLLSGVRGLSTG